MKPVHFVSAALWEIAEVVRSFEAKESDAGGRFFDDLDGAEELISAHPEIGKPTKRGCRRFSLHHFPYDIIYRIDVHETLVVAVAHHSRDPDYWVDRL